MGAGTESATLTEAGQARDRTNEQLDAILEELKRTNELLAELLFRTRM
jgi:hypothetical protein